jgi:cytochrome c biogenesis protein CcmG, thiol:disulfide interchange protein DsbE
LINFLEEHPFNYYILQNAENYKKTLKISSVPRNIFIDKTGYIRYIQGNFPYTALDPKNGIKKYEDNNYFVKIIEELIKKQ